MEPHNDPSGLPKHKLEEEDAPLLSLEHSDEREPPSDDLIRPGSSDPSSPDSFGEFKIEQRMFDAFAPWTAQDEHFVQLFHDWDSLPLPSFASDQQKLATLRELEEIIVPFEKAINCSDEGFAAWRFRHQVAMEQEQSQVPGWPKLHNDKQEWVNDRWVTRYHQLVKEREKLIQWRFQTLHISSLSRGPPTSPPERLAIDFKKWYPKRTQSETLPQFWAHPLDEFLSAEAVTQRVDPQFLLNMFWTPAAPVEIHEDELALTSASSGSELSSPPSIPRTGCSAQAPARCETPTPAGRKFICQEIIEID